MNGSETSANLRRLCRLMLMLLCLGAFPARADDVTATSRGVVRVVTIASAQSQVIGFGHGSGFAIAPDKIVTNAHVVELAAKYPQNVIIGIVPSEGQKSYQGKLIAYDPQKDLAILQIQGTRLPPVTLYSGPVNEGAAVTALGYPGNVDLATAQSSADYITPLGPVRSQGAAAGRRSLTGTEVLLHTASIARGNSGGPLLDPCGRVIGVNSALTKNEDGDAGFAFAISDTALMDFLRTNKQPFQTTGVACVSMADRIAQDRDTDAKAKASADDLARQAAQAARIAHEEALDQARADAQRARENWMAAAVLLLVAGAFAVSAGGILDTRGDRRAAIWTAAIGALLILGAVATFVLRPNGVNLPDAATENIAVPSKAVAAGKLRCTIQQNRGRVNTSATSDVLIDWQPNGCVNGKTQYAEAGGGKWERILVPTDDATVSILGFDPVARTYSNTRYLLTADQMAAARKLRSGVDVKACTADQGVLNKLSSQQTAIRDALPQLPDEELVYSCTASN